MHWPWMLLDDARMIHESTPIQPLEPPARWSGVATAIH